MVFQGIHRLNTSFVTLTLIIVNRGLQHSYVIVPANHRILSPEFKNEAKRHGRISPIGEPLMPLLMEADN
jgi:hypothetical protein